MRLAERERDLRDRELRELADLRERAEFYATRPDPYADRPYGDRPDPYADVRRSLQQGPPAMMPYAVDPKQFLPREADGRSQSTPGFGDGFPPIFFLTFFFLTSG